MDEIEAVKQGRLESILGHLDANQLERIAAAMDDIRAAIVAEGGFEHAHPTHYAKAANERD
jgi:hypothetical protein